VTKVGITDTLLYVFGRTSCATVLTLNWMLFLATDLIIILPRKWSNLQRLYAVSTNIH
jgi:hypothetical protein